MNRGAARQTVFRDERDHRTFLRLLGDSLTTSGVELHAYCLMGNHFHLLARCPEGGLSAWMHALLAPYARYFNGRHGRDGPVFRSRFRSILLDSPTYVDRVGRYIHRNPLDIRPRVALDVYPWSSLRYYVRELPRPAWLTIDTLLGEHHGRAGYREFVCGAPASGAPMWGWAIATALDEAGGGTADRRSGLERTVAVATLDAVENGHRRALDAWLAFPTAEARSMALLRARRRVHAEPALADVVRRVIELAT